MISYRMCVSCRKRKEKQDLIRLIKTDGGAALDESFKAQSRGAYVCKNEQCILNAKSRRAIQRALYCNVCDEIFEEMILYGQKE